MTQLDVDTNAFAVKLMTDFLKLLDIDWTPSFLVTLYLSPSTCDAFVAEYTEIIAIAVRKISYFERSLDIEEFEQLCPIMPCCFEQFLDFFIDCVGVSFMENYTPFNFIRYLRLIMDFSLYCYLQGHTHMLDFAAACISHVILRYKNIFGNNFMNWKKLVNEAERISRDEFQHPYMNNPFFVDNTVMKQKYWNLNNYKR